MPVLNHEEADLGQGLLLQPRCHTDVCKQSFPAEERPTSIFTLNTAADRPRDGTPGHLPASCTR